MRSAIEREVYLGQCEWSRSSDWKDRNSALPSLAKHRSWKLTDQEISVTSVFVTSIYLCHTSMDKFGIHNWFLGQCDRIEGKCWNLGASRANVARHHIPQVIECKENVQSDQGCHGVAERLGCSFTVTDTCTQSPRTENGVI